MSFCTICGAPLESGTRFCGECGKPVYATFVEESVSRPPQPVSISHEDAKRIGQANENAKGMNTLIVLGWIVLIVFVVVGIEMVFPAISSNWAYGIAIVSTLPFVAWALDRTKA